MKRIHRKVLTPYSLAAFTETSACVHLIAAFVLLCPLLLPFRLHGDSPLSFRISWSGRTFYKGLMKGIRSGMGFFNSWPWDPKGRKQLSKTCTHRVANQSSRFNVNFHVLWMTVLHGTFLISATIIIKLRHTHIHFITTVHISNKYSGQHAATAMIQTGERRDAFLKFPNYFCFKEHHFFFRFSECWFLLQWSSWGLNV